MIDFFINKVNFSVETKEGYSEKGIFFENKFEFENKIFNLEDYGNLKSKEHIDRLIENIELLYKYEILWNTIKKV